MSVLAVVLLPRRNRHRQLIFLGRKRTGGIGRQRARRIVGLIEIQHDLAVLYRLGLKKRPGGYVSVLLVRSLKTKNRPSFASPPRASRCSSWPLILNRASPATGVGMTSPSTLGTATVFLPSDGIQSAVILYWP